MTDTRFARDPEDPGFQAVSAPDDAALRCLDDTGPTVCKGPVEYRDALSGTGRSFPRCAKHWDERLDTQERLNRDYPDSPNPPAWFDESYAGERWSDDY